MSLCAEHTTLWNSALLVLFLPLRITRPSALEWLLSVYFQPWPHHWISGSFIHLQIQYKDLYLFCSLAYLSLCKYLAHGRHSNGICWTNELILKSHLKLNSQNTAFHYFSLKTYSSFIPNPFTQLSDPNAQTHSYVLSGSLPQPIHQQLVFLLIARYVPSLPPSLHFPATPQVSPLNKHSCLHSSSGLSLKSILSSAPWLIF